MTKVLKITMIVSAIMALTGCFNNQLTPLKPAEKTPHVYVKDTNNIAFLAFGDGGYSVDYPKKKHLTNPKNTNQFIEKERQDWLDEHRPIAEFDHAPIFVYPNTQTATEQSGAMPVGQAMSKVCQQTNCDFAIQLGDNIYPDGADANDGKDDIKRMNDLILAPLKPLFENNSQLTVFSALGNHDWKTSRKGVQLQAKWMNDQPNFYMAERGYYQFRVGEIGNDVEFFVLDTNMLLSGQTFYDVPLNEKGEEQPLALALANGQAELENPDSHERPMNNEDTKQLDWFEKAISTSTAKWKIVYGHHILWSIGGTKYSEGHALRPLLMPSLCRYGDAYIAGHEHDLELLTDDCSRYTPQSTKPKLPLIISGAASKMRGKHSPLAKYQERAYPEYDLIWSKSFVWGFSRILLDNKTDNLTVEFYTTPSDSNSSVQHEKSFSFKRRQQMLLR